MFHGALLSMKASTMLPFQGCVSLSFAIPILSAPDRSVE